MDAAQVAIVLGAAATLGTVYNGWRQRQDTRDVAKDEDSRARLELAFQMQEKQIERLEERDVVKDKRINLLEETNLHLDRQLQECKQGRHQMELQVEILKLQVGGRATDR